MVSFRMDLKSSRTKQEAYSVGDDNVYLPDGSGGVLPVPEVGCVWVHAANQALEAHVAAHLDLRHGLNLKRGALVGDVSTVDRLKVPHLKEKQGYGV